MHFTFRRITGDGELRQAMAVRRDVFVKEQGISAEEEYDGRDASCLHFAAFNERKIVGTARVRFSEACARVERMAVLREMRRRGVGAGILACVEAELTGRHVAKAVLHAQVAAAPFYHACGYSVTGERFFEAGIEHVPMEKLLPGSPPQEQPL